MSAIPTRVTSSKSPPKNHCHIFFFLVVGNFILPPVVSETYLQYTVYTVLAISEVMFEKVHFSESLCNEEIVLPYKV